MGQVRDADYLTEKALDTMRSLVKAVGHDASILKKGYLDLLCPFTDRV